MKKKNYIYKNENNFLWSICYCNEEQYYISREKNIVYNYVYVLLLSTKY